MTRSATLQVLNPATGESIEEMKHVHIEPKVEKKEWWYPYGSSAGEAGDEGQGQRTM